jgi:hypothetical protein
VLGHALRVLGAAGTERMRHRGRNAAADASAHQRHDDEGDREHERYGGDRVRAEAGEK